MDAERPRAAGAIAWEGLLLIGVLLLVLGSGYGIWRASVAPVQADRVESEERELAPADAHVLRVCADPNNLPFTNRDEQGFENRIAELVAADLGRTLRYYWLPQRRGFVRNTLNAHRCDVVLGAPADFELAWTTRAYYRSSYVFVTRHDGRPPVRSLDDPRLRQLRIGVPVVGEDYQNPPALEALAVRHIVDNVHPYMVYGNYGQPNPLAGLIAAVAAGEVDVAIAWGPTAGFFARTASAPLAVTPAQDGPALPFTFAMAMAVRRGDRALQLALDDVIARRQPEIDAILTAHGVPLLPIASPAGARHSQARP